MIHIVNRIMSTRIPNLRYTMPGFGDAIHTILLAYLYGKAHNDQVTMHLDKDKYNKDKPGTYITYAGYLSLLLSVISLVISKFSRINILSKKFNN